MNPAPAPTTLAFAIWMEHNCNRCRGCDPQPNTTSHAPSCPALISLATSATRDIPLTIPTMLWIGIADPPTPPPRHTELPGRCRNFDYRGGRTRQGRAPWNQPADAATPNPYKQ